MARITILHDCRMGRASVRPQGEDQGWPESQMMEKVGLRVDKELKNKGRSLHAPPFCLGICLLLLTVWKL